MSMRHLAVGLASVALLAGATVFAAADSGSSSSQSSSAVNSYGSGGNNSASSTVGIGGQGSQQAAATPGGFGISGSVSGGSGYASGWSNWPSSGSYANGVAGTAGFAFAKSGLSQPEEPNAPDRGPSPLAGGGNSTQLCILTVKDWAKWRAMSFAMRRAAARCQCPTDTKLSTASRHCPAPNGVVFTASAR